MEHEKESKDKLIDELQRKLRYKDTVIALMDSDLREAKKWYSMTPTMWLIVIFAVLIILGHFHRMAMTNLFGYDPYSQGQHLDLPVDDRPQ